MMTNIRIFIPDMTGATTHDADLCTAVRFAVQVFAVVIFIVTIV